MTMNEVIEVLEHRTGTGHPDEDFSSFNFNATIQQVRQALDITIDVLQKVDAAGYIPHVGYWEYRGRQKGYFCTFCGGGCLLNLESDWFESAFCPHCGAKMINAFGKADDALLQELL